MTGAQLQAFFAMGGHALYVWLAWGVSLFAIVAYVLRLKRLRTRVHEALRWQANLDGADVQTASVPATSEETKIEPQA